MRFMSYNIKACMRKSHNPKDQSEVPGIMGIAEVIAAQSPDVVALQEVDRWRLRSGRVDQVRQLGESLGYHYAYAPAFSSLEADGRKGEYGNALLSRLPILSWDVVRLWHRSIPFPGEPLWVIEPRCCFIAQLQLIPSGLPDLPVPSQADLPTQIDSSTQDIPNITVMGLHLSTTEDQRARQLEHIADLVSERCDFPLVLMGDFNAGHEELNTSRLSGLLTNILAGNPIPTFPEGEAAQTAIDHIFVSRQWAINAVWVVSDRLGRSDHNPIVADLELRG
ncbi:MAG: hypothetical protein HPY52_10980 [Firmicutes bacterium]|nr:hypothetical protein [Bacillota bacterium]